MLAWFKHRQGQGCKCRGHIYVGERGELFACVAFKTKDEKATAAAVVTVTVLEGANSTFCYFISSAHGPRSYTVDGG